MDTHDKKATEAPLAGPRLDETVARFKSSMTRGMAAIKEAAELYVDALLRHPALARERFRKECPAISERAWKLLEAIGSGDLNPAAFMLPCATAEKLSHIPIDRQDAMFASPGEYKVVDPYSGRLRFVPLHRMTALQSDILFDVERGRIRSEEEQREMLASRQAESVRKAKSEPVPYRILGNTVVINGVRMGRNLLARILAEMDAGGEPQSAR